MKKEYPAARRAHGGGDQARDRGRLPDARGSWPRSRGAILSRGSPRRSRSPTARSARPSRSRSARSSARSRRPWTGPHRSSPATSCTRASRSPAGCPAARDRQAARHETGMPVHIADNPLSSVAIGSGKCLEEFEVLQRVLVSPSGVGPRWPCAPERAAPACWCGARLDLARDDHRGLPRRRRRLASLGDGALEVISPLQEVVSKVTHRRELLLDARPAALDPSRARRPARTGRCAETQLARAERTRQGSTSWRRCSACRKASRPDRDDGGPGDRQQGLELRVDDHDRQGLERRHLRGHAGGLERRARRARGARRHELVGRAADHRPGLVGRGRLDVSRQLGLLGLGSPPTSR